MTRWDWGTSGTVDGILLNNAAGTPNTPGIRTTPRELVRLGLLYLNRGNWNGRQLLPASFVDEAVKNEVPNAGRSTDLRGRYGFFWRTNDVMADGKRMWPSAPAGTYMSNGNGCNFCIVLPEWKMVIVRMGTVPLPEAGRQARFDAFLRGLPGRSKTHAGPAPADRQRVLPHRGRWLAGRRGNFRRQRGQHFRGRRLRRLHPWWRRLGRRRRIVRLLRRWRGRQVGWRRSRGHVNSAG